MKSIHIKQWVILTIGALFYLSCNNQWDDHINTNDEFIEGNVLDAVKKMPSLSVFNSFLVNTGYDKVISGANNYTVFAPDNEALSGYETASLDIQKKIVSNHIAFLIKNNEELKGKIRVINGKNLDIENVSLLDSEILCNNGILRIASNVVLPKENIYEVINGHKEKYLMASIIANAGDSVMDPDKSVQMGVDKNSGLPYYDTVWMYQNPYIDSIAINNEDSLYTLLLLEDENFEVLRDKYSKYMNQLDDPDGSKTDAVATQSLIYDLICKYTTEDDMESVSGIKIDSDTATINENITASNGNIYVANGVNIKMKNNKIKDVIVQAESFIESLEPTWVYTRMRDQALGGKDIMLSSYWTSSATVNTTTPSGADTTYTVSYRFIYDISVGTNYSKKINSYVKYRPNLFSTDYNVFWVTNDDIADHFKGDTLDPDYDPLIPNKPCPSVYRVMQKMYIAEEGKNLNWSSGMIVNAKKSGRAKVMVGIDPETADQRVPNIGVNAGVLQVEQPLRWHQASGDFDAVTMALTSDKTRDVLTINSAGEIDIMVTNSAKTEIASSVVNGFIFLDYIRFSPIIDEND